MEYDNTIRLLLTVTFAVTLPLAASYRWRSHTGEPLDRWQEGAWILFGLRLSAVPLFFAELAWMIQPAWMAWSSLPMPIVVRWLGLIVVVAAGALLVWTFHNLGKNLTDTVVTRKNHFLVLSGPYRFVRHPFYVSFALFVMGTSLAMANWFIPLVGAIPFAFIVARTRIEERKLVDRFGSEYEVYMQRVGRFVPRCW